MSKDNMTLTISAKDLASATFQRVKASGIAMGVAIGNLASKAVVGMVNGLRGWVNEALEAEKANVMLDAALRGSGQYTADLSKKYRDLANAIQDETGASDESVKSNIALLVSMGVLPQKMDAAARGIQALSALNIEGSMAARAISRALNGDIAAFDRLSPEVRNATTITEKYAAANKLLEAGYAQQKANLQTVGGAWQALKGRIGDAREEIIGAIFEGLKLGKTFDSMQSSVGAFLKSESFKNFTDRLRDGAAFAKDIMGALTTPGGFTETLGNIGNLILAAMKDGADYLKNQMKEKTGVGKAAGTFKLIGAGAKAWLMNAGDQQHVVERVVDAMGMAQAEIDNGSGGGGNLVAMIAKMKADFEKRKAGTEATPNVAIFGGEAPGKEGEKARHNQALLNAGEEIALKEQDRKLGIEAKITSAKEHQLGVEKEISRLAEEEQQDRTIAQNARRAAANIAKVGVADWIANARQANDNLKDENKRNRKENRRLDELRRRQAAGIKLSDKDIADLAAADRQKNQAATLAQAAAKAAKEAEDLKQKQEKYQEDTRKLQDRIALATESLVKKIDTVLVDGGQ